MHAVRRACHFVSGCVNDVLLECCAKHLAIYCDVVGTQKRQLSSNKSTRQKYLLLYHYKAKLSSDVLIVLANINE